jgi:DNA/RNA-binding domain of Phe-tRNA-synthetase-like protein
MEPELHEGWVDPELAAEFPELALTWAPVEARPARSGGVLRRRLRELSDRYTGGRVIHMRQDAVPWAYRVFWRQVGIDPDESRTPVERVALDRMKAGGFRSSNSVDDSLTIAVAETGVPVVAFDGDRVEGRLGLRLSEDGELLGGGGRPLSARQIVIADERRSLAVLVDEIAPEGGVTPATERMIVAALAVRGVPRISVEEALWTAAELLLVGGTR